MRTRRGPRDGPIKSVYPFRRGAIRRETNDHPMLESVPAYVEFAIYCYFGLVAAIGLSVHVRLWHRYRRAEYADDGATETAADDGTV
ncbi:hypothetical protein [Halosolutus halophilus]|uniref:hypothetical protein n=1 Tax=Halosolutus halophilus TaxID=1552990 RepID=UPI0022350A8E|nr:hypothetical protein [Halosolutus halophilus]